MTAQSRVRSRLLRLVLAVIASAVIAMPLLWVSTAYVPSWRRSSRGRLARSMIRNEPIVRQLIDDMAVDIQDRQLTPRFQTWADEMRAKYRAGTLASQPTPEFWPPPAVRIPDAEIPAWLLAEWHDEWAGRGPEAWIGLADDGAPGFVFFGWYLCGVAVGPAPVQQLDFAWERKQAAPNIYTYGIEK